MTQDALSGLANATRLASAALFAGKWEVSLLAFTWIFPKPVSKDVVKTGEVN